MATVLPVNLQARSGDDTRRRPGEDAAPAGVAGIAIGAAVILMLLLVVFAMAMRWSVGGLPTPQTPTAQG